MKRKNSIAGKSKSSLIDEGFIFMELGLFAGYGMYEEYGGAGSIRNNIRIGKSLAGTALLLQMMLQLKDCMVPYYLQKEFGAQEISIENKLPIIYLD